MNPSRIEERAKLLVKMQVVKEQVAQRKRRGGWEAMDMDHSEDEGVWEYREGSMLTKTRRNRGRKTGS